MNHHIPWWLYHGIWYDSCVSYSRAVCSLTRVIGSVVAWNRQVHRYSPELLARMPVKFVLQQSQKTPSLYSGVYSPLLRWVICVVSVVFWLSIVWVNIWVITRLTHAKPCRSAVDSNFHQWHLPINISMHVWALHLECSTLKDILFSVCLSVSLCRLSLSSVCLSICLSVCRLSVCLSLSVVCLSVCRLSVSLSLSVSLCLSSVYLSVCLSSLCLSVCLSLSSLCLSVCLFLSLSLLSLF